MLEGDPAFPASVQAQPAERFPGDKDMPSRTSNWIIALGGTVAFLGLCCLAASVGDRTESNLLGLGATFFGMGALIWSSGIYLKARILQNQATGQSKETSARRPLHGGCDLCKVEVPVILCRVHQFHLCAHCMAEHYDFRSCVYVPSVRRAMSRSAKSAAAHGA
jgi:hypothetical protein